MDSQNLSFQIGVSAAGDTQTKWMICLNGEDVGECIYQKAGFVWDIVDIQIRESQRRQGLGLRLLQHILSEARREGCEEIFSEVRTSNVAAIGLYEKLGFERKALRRSYYADGEDAVVMQFLF